MPLEVPSELGEASEAVGSELRFPTPASAREEMNSLPRPGWLRRWLLGDRKLAAVPSFCERIISLVPPGLRGSFIKFNGKEEAEH